MPNTHTKGPWSCYDRSRSIRIKSAHATNPICTIDNKPKARDERVTRANANLIAHSPDLKETLEELLDLAQDMYTEHKSEGVGYYDTPIKKAQDLLKKIDKG